jgi:acetyl esterase/lipase
VRNYLIVLFVFIGIAFASCSKKDSTNGGNLPLDLSAKTLPDVSYGSSNQQKMDIYLPADRSVTSTKVLVLIHGGAWAEGDKGDFNIYIDTLKKRLPGWAIININYRLYNLINNRFPTQENDVKSAVNFIYNNRSYYTISEKWVLLGASAGGHLAMLQGYKNNSVIKPKAVINYFGPSDLNKLENEETDSGLRLGMQMLFNGKETESSPINFINAQTPPTLTLQGLSDNTVPPSQQQVLHAKLNAFGVSNRLELYPNEGHGFSETTMSKTFDLVTQFLATYVP